MNIFAALVAGVLFGAGLTIAQMIDPQKVLGFLDLAGIAKGTWDPTLLMVFIGALPPMFAAYGFQRSMQRPWVGGQFFVPQRTDIDARLLGGSALFGIGWGLAGICPGPAITAVGLAGKEIANVALFVAAMCAGVMLSWLVAPSPTAPATEART